VNGAWVERFRRWETRFPTSSRSGPILATSRSRRGRRPRRSTRGPAGREPDRAHDQGVLIEVDHPSLRAGVERLVVLGVDWTQVPEKAAASLGTLFDGAALPTSRLRSAGHAHEQHLGEQGRVHDGGGRGGGRARPVQGPARSTSGQPGHGSRRLLDCPPPRSRASRGRSARARLGIGAGRRPLARDRRLLHQRHPRPLAKDNPQVDADLRELPCAATCSPAARCPPCASARSPSASCPSSPRAATSPGSRLRRSCIGSPRSCAASSRRRSRACRICGGRGRPGRGHASLALLQRTPVPWTFRFRPLTGPIERKNMSVR
jgi:hypothetical protein